MRLASLRLWKRSRAIKGVTALPVFMYARMESHWDLAIASPLAVSFEPFVHVEPLVFRIPTLAQLTPAPVIDVGAPKAMHGGCFFHVSTLHLVDMLVKAC